MNKNDAEVLFNRIKNFYCNYDDCEKSFECNVEFFQGLVLIKNEIISQYKIESNYSKEHLLDNIIHAIFTYCCQVFPPYSILFEDSKLYHTLESSFSYLLLCLFINSSKRTEAMSLNKYVYKYSPNEFYNKESAIYCSFDAPNSVLDSNADTLRQYRYRTYKARNSKSYKEQGQAMTIDSVTEWSLYFKLVSNPVGPIELEVSETLKQLRTIYNDLEKIQKYKYTSDFNLDIAKISNLYKSFQKKAKDLSFEKFINFYKFVLDFLKSDEKYYGINIFRLEKMLNPYHICLNVNRIKSNV